jgi:hypothetical protein
VAPFLSRRRTPTLGLVLSVPPDPEVTEYIYSVDVGLAVEIVVAFDPSDGSEIGGAWPDLP